MQNSNTREGKERSPKRGRVHPRLRCRGIARFRSLPHGRFIDGALVDLSLRGCCIESDGSPHMAPESAVEVILKVKGTALRLGGIVRHRTRQTRTGIQFLDVSPRKKEQIEELMEELLEMDKNVALEQLIDPDVPS